MINKTTNTKVSENLITVNLPTKKFVFPNMRDYMWQYNDYNNPHTY